MKKIQHIQVVLIIIMNNMFRHCTRNFIKNYKSIMTNNPSLIQNRYNMIIYNGPYTSDIKKISNDIFDSKIKKYNFLMNTYVDAYLNQYTNLPIDIVVTNHYLEVDKTQWLSFLHTEKLEVTTIHTPTEEMYDTIMQNKLNKFICDYVDNDLHNTLHPTKLKIEIIKTTIDGKKNIDLYKKKLIDNKKIIGFIYPPT